MLNTNYANAYKEVLIVINNLVKEDYDKIPKKYIEFFSANCNNDYEFEYDKTKTFQEQELLDDTKYILFGLFEKFGATEKQKDKIMAFRNNYYNKLEEKRKKYNMDDIFKKKELINKDETTTENIDANKLPIKVEQENIFKRVFNCIMRFFHIK